MKIFLGFYDFSSFFFSIVLKISVFVQYCTFYLKGAPDAGRYFNRINFATYITEQAYRHDFKIKSSLGSMFHPELSLNLFDPVPHADR